MTSELGLRSAGSSLFVGGFIIHLALMNVQLLRAHGFRGAELSTMLLLQSGIPSIGGVFVCLLFKPTINRKRQEKETLPAPFRLALLGLCATWLTLFASFVGMAIIISLQGPLLLLPMAIFFALLGIVTYGMGAVILSMPLALLYGAALPWLIKKMLRVSWAEEWFARCYRGG